MESEAQARGSRVRVRGESSSCADRTREPLACASGSIGYDRRGMLCFPSDPPKPPLGKGGLSTQRRGMLLVVVLLIISLLALVGATFSFRMHADLAAVQARKDLTQAEQAARTALDRVIFILRTQRTNIDKWYN